MKTFRDAMRADIEEQFELPEMPPPMTANRAKDIRKPCHHCQPARCACIGWEAFDVTKH